ncbi:MAG: zinc ABC transporter substrate-binding protein, partial [Candidatus Altiarchaeales archaeon]
MNKTERRILLLFIAVCLTVGCITEKPAGGERLGVVVTILPQADFVKKVGGSRVRVTVMVPPGASPHTYEPTPGQLMETSKAKIYFKVGSGVEFENVWMDRIRAINPDMVIIDGSEGITKREGDPHIWNSPINAKKMVENIYNGLIRVDPANADEYTR